MTTTPRLARRCGTAAWVTKKLPFAVAPKAASQSASVTSSTDRGANPAAAALTSRSRPPSSSTARPTSARPGSEAARSPSALPAARTDHPSAWRRSEIGFPIRPVPPVTRARMFGECKDTLKSIRNGDQTEWRPNRRVFMMRRLLGTTFAVAAVLAVAPALSATKTVDITQAGFTPSKVTIDCDDRRERRLDLDGEAGHEHDLPGELEEHEERPADGEGFPRRHAQARPSASLLDIGNGRAVVRWQVRRAPALRPSQARLENGQ